MLITACKAFIFSLWCFTSVFRSKISSWENCKFIFCSSYSPFHWFHFFFSLTNHYANKWLHCFKILLESKSYTRISLSMLGTIHRMVIACLASASMETTNKLNFGYIKYFHYLASEKKLIRFSTRRTGWLRVQVVFKVGVHEKVFALIVIKLPTVRISFFIRISFMRTHSICLL